jgi:hypothetical protein
VERDERGGRMTRMDFSAGYRGLDFFPYTGNFVSFADASSLWRVVICASSTYF